MKHKIKTAVLLAIVLSMFFTSTAHAGGDYSYEYKTEVSGWQYKTVSADLGKQPKNGTCFGSYGGFYFTTSGGPSISVSLSGPLGRVLQASISMGDVTSSGGRFIMAPDTYNRFSSNATWQLESTYALPGELMSEYYYCKKVNTSYSR